jgi:hypothetical protein
MVSNLSMHFTYPRSWSRNTLETVHPCLPRFIRNDGRALWQQQHCLTKYFPPHSKTLSEEKLILKPFTMPEHLLTVNPHFRFQVRSENNQGKLQRETGLLQELCSIDIQTTHAVSTHLTHTCTTGKPIHQFMAIDLNEATYDALVQKVFATSVPNEDLGQYNVTLKYLGKLQDWWINIANTEGMGYAIEDNQDQGYTLISATIESKIARAVAPKVEILPLVSYSTKAAAKPKAVKKRTTVKHSAPSRSSTGEKKSVEEKILSAMAELRQIGISAPPRVQVAFFSGYGNMKSAGFATALSILKTKGHIEYQKQTVILSETGIANAGPVADPSTSNADAQERIKNILKGGKTTGLVLDQLSDGLAHIRKDVATATGYGNEKSSGFATTLSTMKSLGILVYPKDTTDSKKNLIQLTDIMFPFGRPGSTGTSNNTVPTNCDAEVSADEDAIETLWL